MSALGTAGFWVAAAERALKTVAQTLVVLLGATTVGVLDADWVTALSLAGMAGVLSLLTSIASVPVGEAGPSLGGEALVAPAADDHPGGDPSEL